MEKTTVFQAKKEYVLRKIGKSNVLISIKGNVADLSRYIELNESALFLWKQLQDTCTAGELEEKLEKEFDISHEEAIHDVLQFLGKLQNYNMIQIQ